MDTVAEDPAEQELHLLTDWSEPEAKSRRRAAVVGTVLVHLLGMVTVLTVPPELLAPPERTSTFRVTLVEPPLTRLTQRAPNKGKLSAEFEAPDLTPRASVQVPSGPPTVTRPRAAQPAPIPAPPPRPAAPLPEPPRMEAQAPAPRPPIPTPPPPQIQTEEKPKLAFEAPPAAKTVEPGQGRLAAPDSSVSHAINQNLRSGSGGGGLMVGDSGTGEGGVGEAAILQPSPGSSGSALQLLSDPQGVDFRPYLTRILAAVKLNWLKILPESVRLGRRGRVAIQFSINREGNVPKLVIASSSGADALDRAAIAGISASVPFPPLPREFKGDLIKLQFNFAYNIPRQ